MVNAWFPIPAGYGFESMDARKRLSGVMSSQLKGKFTANPIVQILYEFSDNCADSEHRGFIRDCYEGGRLRNVIATG